MSAPDDDVLPKTIIWPDRPEGPVQERPELVPGAHPRVFRVVVVNGYASPGRPELYTIEVVSKTAKQVKVADNVATKFRSTFSHSDFARLFFATPEAAIEAWKADIAREIVELEEKIGELNALVAKEVKPSH
jgi:hypothetical protein